MSFFKKIILHRGIFYILISSVIFTSNSAVSKILKNIPSPLFTASRGFFCFFLSSNLCCYYGYNLRHLKNAKFVYLCGLLRMIGYITKITCIANMPMGDATAIYFTMPIYTGIFARIFLKEPWGIVHAVSTVLGVCLKTLLGANYRYFISEAFETKH